MNIETTKLSDAPVRELTDREVAALLSGYLGSLADVSTVDNVKRALMAVLSNQLFWQMIEQRRDMVKKAAAQLLEQQQLANRSPV